MSAKRPDVKPHFKLWLSSSASEGVFGDGKWRLLGAIEATGSLRAAADSLGMSYRKAWGDLKKAEEQLGVLLVERRRGGSSGGRTTVTTDGRRWLAAYSRFRGQIEDATQRAFKSNIAELLKKGRKKR